MAMTKIYDLAFEIDGDQISLEQDVGCGDVHKVILHPIHLRHLAEQLMPLPEPRTATLERRIRWLRDRFLEADEALPADFVDRVADAGFFYEWLTASCEVANEFCADLTPIETAPQADRERTENGQILLPFSEKGGTLTAMAGSTNRKL